jgi:hypothetical protein
MFEYRANNWRLTWHYQSTEQLHLDNMLLQAQIYLARFNYDVVATATETSHNYSKHKCMCTWYCKLQCCTKSFGSFWERLTLAYRKLPSQKQVKRKIEFECTYLNYIISLGGQVDRWSVRIVSRVHIFWHSSSIHEGYVWIVNESYAQIVSSLSKLVQKMHTWSVKFWIV